MEHGTYAPPGYKLAFASPTAIMPAPTPDGPSPPPVIPIEQFNIFSDIASFGYQGTLASDPVDMVDFE